jgi:hypothetical protein
MTERKKYPRSEWMEETKAKQNDWKKKNRSVLACDVSKEIGDKFKAYCKEQGKSVSSVLAEYVNSLLLAMENETRSEIQDVSSNFQDGSGSDTPGTVDLPTANDTPGPVD